MFKNVLILCFLSFSFLQVSCSSKSSSGGDGDLDISEIKKIESTGEFSEDEFFSDDELVAEDSEAGKLIDVPGDDVAADGELSGNLEDVGGDLDLEILEEGEADLLADADLDVSSDFSEDSGEVSTDLAEDSGELNVDELGEDSADIVSDAGAELLLEEGVDSDFGEFEDETLTKNVGNPNAENNVTIDAGEMDDLIASDIDGEQPTASELLSEQDEVKIDNSDVGFFDQETASQKLKEDDEVTISNDFSDFDDEPTVDTSISSSDIMDGEDVSIDSSFDDISSGPVATEDSFIETESSSTEFVAPKKAPIPVKKMKTVPYERNGILANSIYFVRSGDSLSSIANKIYGSGSAVDFTIVNPHLKPGALRVGQKVYYNSPRRPQDRSRLITFYEDTGLPAQYYQASTGENIRKISKDLLGHSRSWMEVWASNQDIVSKGNLDSSYSVRYWMGNNTSSPAVLASNKPSQAYQPKNPVVSQPVKTATARKSDTRSSLEAEIEMDQRIEDTQASVNNDLNEAELEDFDEEPIASAPTPGNNNNPRVNNRPSSSGSSNPVRPNVSGTVNQVNNDIDDMEDDIDFSKDDIGDTAVAPKPINNFNRNRNNNAATNGNINPEKPREIAKRPSFPISKRRGALSKSMIESLALGFGGILLLLAVILIVRKKRKRAEAIQMDSFDFGGETTIESEQTKTQIDI